MKKIIIASLALIAFLLVGILGFRYLAAQKEAPPKRKPEAVRKFVQTREVAYRDISTDIVSFGRVQSAQPLEVITEVAGRIRAGVPLKEGQRFRKGQLLFKIDDTEARLTLKAQKSSFLRDIAMILPDFKVDFAESYPTWERYFKAIDVEKPLPELPTYRSSKEKTFLAVKNILTNYYNIRQREENLKKYKVVAPFSGTIAEVMLQDGSFVNSGSRVAKLRKTSALELQLPIETNNIRWISKGTKVNVSTEDGRQQWVGRIIRIGELVSEATQSLNIFIRLSGSERLYEGMYLKAVIPGSTITSAMEVPRNILNNGNEVFVIEDDSVLRVKEVEVKKINAETAVIAGLEAGSSLVVEPLAAAYNGMTLFRLRDAEKYETARKPEKDKDSNSRSSG